MSLDQRCQQFHDAAMGVIKSKGPSKENCNVAQVSCIRIRINVFTDKAISRLFDTIQIYYNATADVDSDSKEGLLEDALKNAIYIVQYETKESYVEMVRRIAWNYW